MLFSSWSFMLGFLPVALCVFYLIPARQLTARKLWLAFASLCFYGYWKLAFVPLLLFSMAFNYGAATLIHRWRGRPAARWVVVANVGVNLLLLGYYKYTNFILSSLGWGLGFDLGHFDIILPLAISFFTFTQIGYVVDVYREPGLRYAPLDYALFVLFFPHLIAGPIVRHWEIIPQYRDRALRVAPADIGVGLAFFLMGLCKKTLLADPVAQHADAIYAAAGAGAVLPWFDAWLGTLAFGLQIYFDFSGYSDMAIGLARLFGIKFPSNFDSPYRATSIDAFWRRWHISLTRFLRDYVYIPLGGNRRGPRRQAVNILATFLLSGLWHGAGWTFVIWGALHGAYLVAANGWRNWLERRGWRPRHWSYRGGCLILTFVVVLFAWVFFRAPDLKVAARIASSMAAMNGFTVSAKTTNPDGQAGRFLQVLGCRFVADTAGLEGYTAALRLVVALLALAWLLPNTQQLLRDYDPLVDSAIRPSRWRLPLTAATGALIGGLFFFVVRTHYTAAPSPFLYFNF